MSEYQTHLCPACAAGIFEECSNPQRVKLLDDVGVYDGTWIIPCAISFELGQLTTKEKGLVGRPLADPEQITDVKSTGRKRAAAIMPFLKGQVCGWAGLKHAGGGVIPILGCQGNTITEAKKTEEAREKGYDEVGHRHHGPDKNVLNNTPGMNLHGICTVCHTRWHAINDPFYSENGRPDNAAEPFLPVEPYYLHDSQTTFTEDEWGLAEAWWDLPVKERGQFPFQPREDARRVFPADQKSATLDPSDNPWDDGDPFEIGES